MCAPVNTESIILDNRDATLVLPKDEVLLPASDVTDFRDVVEAINRLCDTMKTSYEYETSVEDTWVYSEMIDPEMVIVEAVEVLHAESCFDTCVEMSTASDEQPTAQCDPISGYFTASSELSLQSDTELVAARCRDDPNANQDQGYLNVGHVAAMRERFESMTRANTPCPDLTRSISPTLDVFRVTPSPDDLG